MVKYFNNELILTDDVSQMPIVNGILKYSIFLLCSDGKLSFNIEEKAYTVSQNQVMTSYPGSHLTQIMISPDFKCKIMCLNPESYSQLMYISKQIWVDIQYSVGKPVMTLSKSSCDVFNTYLDTMLEKLSREDVPYKKEYVRYLVGCVVLEFLALLEQNIPAKIADSISHKDNLTKQFLEIISSEDGKIRSVSEVASRLNITPKYLSFIVKKNTGKNAYDFIRDASFHAIQNRLLYSGASIKEIANEFKFPSLSFFGKFIKQRTGLSPKDFRKSRMNKK